MTKYTATVEPAGKTHRIGPYLLYRKRYVDSDGRRHRGWMVWSGDWEIGTGAPRPLPLVLIKHWRHIRTERRWNKRQT